MKTIDKFILKHELFLKYLFSSFAIDNCEIKDTLYEFAKIEFRHLKWLGQQIDKNDLHLNRAMLKIDSSSTNEIIQFLIDETKLFLKQLNPDNDIEARIISDEYFFIEKLSLLMQKGDYLVKAFDKNMKYENKNLDKNSLQSLMLFLFEESYKEYELIMIYFYMQFFTDNKTIYDVYQDLIDESFFHLKSFGNMMSKLGILAIPRVVSEQIYKNIDIKKFIIDGIEEEKNAKEECRKLAQAVNDDEFRKFFDFINYQESFHIVLMEKLLKNLN